MRKAFLALDSDYDGFITVEELLKLLGSEAGFDFKDLKKLVMDKDSFQSWKLVALWDLL